ncbi:hypothetical protein Tsubulata_043313 [Turnera subulata]|uniref:WRKY domain-containing protein n=1 Tax=Turnera subulata TaxID=218843 RepID=A0A9Q0JIW0_9ROSI|nr:hypothetical protein Tsubulata_043313 [Turnera subulata]
MELFLPFSSSATSTSSASSLPLDMANNNISHGFFDFQETKESGFAALMQDMAAPVTVNNIVNNDDQNKATDILQNKRLVGSESTESGKSIVGGKRKVEKKIKKPRYAFQTRSQVDILDDGYRWRKYGQKAVKNNKFPRSYYRCTHQGCNVKKQVQRLTKDEGIVVTTYEGMHSHPIEKSTDNFEHILSQMQIYNFG